MSGSGYGPTTHYDRVSAAWTLLLGEELHYGVFGTGNEDLATATHELTRLMAEAAEPRPGLALLDVGCGIGAPACFLARELDVRVTGISTSAVGVGAARARAASQGLSELVTFEERDGMDNRFPDETFDRVWVLESSHLMRRRDRLMAECSRVLRSGGRLTLCDVVLRRPMPLSEVRELRGPLSLLREVFGDARMEPLALYRELAAKNGLVVDLELDLTAETRATFARWRENAELHREQLADRLGEAERSRFVEACDVLEGFWDDGTLGYALLAGAKP